MKKTRISSQLDWNGFLANRFLLPTVINNCYIKFALYGLQGICILYAFLDLFSFYCQQLLLSMRLHLNVADPLENMEPKMAIFLCSLLPIYNG